MEPGKPPCLLLPTVCVNGGKTSSSTEQPSTSDSASTSSITSSPSLSTTSQAQSTSTLHFEIVSPKPRAPVSSNALFFHRWYAYRDERTSSSSSDSGVASLQFSPPHLLPLGSSVSSAVMALSPPGLSPLNMKDSAFSTPSREPKSVSRFTFDHIPFQNHSAGRLESCEVTSAFELPSSSGKDPERLKDVLMTVRRHEDVTKHRVLQRKESVIQSTRKGDPTHILLFSSPANAVVSPSLSSPLSSVESYRLAASPSYMGLSPTQRGDACLISDLQKSPESLSSEPHGDDDDKKQYYCTICKKDFKRPDILSRHLRRHTGEKPFGCDACGRYFSRSDHLRTHRRTHTDEKPYQCYICPYAARRRDVLTRHMSTRHQAKAGLSKFQKHRDVRRCLSDGDHGPMSSSSRVSEPSTPKRIRHTTDISPVREHPEHRDRALTEVVTSRNRQATETSHEEIPLMNEIEDDVIVDVCELEQEEDDDDEDDDGDETEFGE